MATFNSIDGLSAWMDDSLEPAQSWPYEIQAQLDRAECVIVLLSPDVNRPKTTTQDISFVINEIAYAKREGKAILPVLAKQTKIPVQLASIQNIDLTADFETGLGKIVQAVLKQAGITKQAAIGKKTSSFRASSAILGSLHKWLYIPEGTVTLISEPGWERNYIPEGKSKRESVPAFEIAKYPVTNSQYREFVNANGYAQSKWWTGMGWRENENNGWSEPRFWRNRDLNEDTLPVIGISWFEAIAFCSWLSDCSGENVSLPTEAQWQRAAQGDHHNSYPWGDIFNPAKCNFNSKRPTPVTAFEDKGKSYFGVADMSGNVWEWCLTLYETGYTDIEHRGVRVLRGGSWRSERKHLLRTDYRAGFLPNSRDDVWGFRIVRNHVTTA